MADAMVLKSQQWLNSTFGGRTGYISVTEDGLTGWETIYGLRRALQIELGITSTSSNFGPSTTANFNSRFPNGVQQQNAGAEYEDNIYGIIQCACWCKGYSTGASDITKHFYGGTGSAIISLKSDAGCSSTNSTVTLNVMKALLSMDQFKKVSTGTNKIRQIQQTLNNEYEAYIGLSPCDGLYGREMNESLIKVLQAIEGYSVSEATGNFGSGTKANLPILPNLGQLSQVTAEKATKLVRYALCCNGYDVSINSGDWDTELFDAIEEFQGDMCLEETRICETNTWMALLLSTGNPDRSSIASDTRYEITNTVAQYLNNNGYQIVGRYLTGGDFKQLRNAEPKRLLNAGINFFPIFQESGANLSYFTSTRGREDAKKAVKAARKYGIPANNIIYFAVDADPTDYQISTYILPYFQAVSANIGQSYKVGVYGTRNVCTRVMNNGYAITCMVADESTGFSGNMGFKMPENWNFDQFYELKQLNANGEIIDLDKVSYSGRFPVVNEVYDSIISFTSKIRDLETLYLQYKTSNNETCTVNQMILGITNFLRSFKYGSLDWTIVTMASIDNNFINYVINNNINLYNEIEEYATTNNGTALHDIYGGFIDIGHLAATIEGYYSNTMLVPNFWSGWGGDLASLVKVVNELEFEEGGTYLDIAKRLLGEAGTVFSYADLCSDADAIKISQMLEDTVSNHPVSDVFNNYFLEQAEYRLLYFLQDIGNVSLDLTTLKNAIYNKMTGLAENLILIPLLGVINYSALSACSEAFAQYIIDNYPTA